MNVPLSRLSQLAAEDGVVRIETHTKGRQLLDVTPQWIKSEPVYSGMSLPQAYTGKEVLVGIIDGGFDVTHPTFYATDGQQLRIKRFIDDTTTDEEGLGTQTPLGHEYSTTEDILAKAHSTDVNDYHGTHCLSIAAGSGHGTPYRGIAYDADLFANASGPLHRAGEQSGGRGDGFGNHSLLVTAVSTRSSERISRPARRASKSTRVLVKSGVLNE